MRSLQAPLSGSNSAACAVLCKANTYRHALSLRALPATFAFSLVPYEAFATMTHYPMQSNATVVQSASRIPVCALLPVLQLVRLQAQLQL